MPPAFVLSQDQTLKFDVRHPPRRNNREERRSFQGAVPAHHIYCGYVTRHIERLGFNRAPDALKPSDPGPPPTCPFIKPTMSKSQKRGRLILPPLSGSPGRLVLIATAGRTVWPVAAVKGHIWRPPTGVNSLFAILFQAPETTAENKAFQPLPRRLCRIPVGASRPWPPPDLNGFARESDGPAHCRALHGPKMGIGSGVSSAIREPLRPG